MLKTILWTLAVTWGLVGVAHADDIPATTRSAAPQLKPAAPEAVQQFWQNREAIRQRFVADMEAFLGEVRLMIDATRAGEVVPGLRAPEYKKDGDRIVARFQSDDQRIEALQTWNYTLDRRTRWLELEKGSLVAYPWPTDEELNVGWIGRLKWRQALVVEVIDDRNVLLQLDIPDKPGGSTRVQPLVWLAEYDTTGMTPGRLLSVEPSVWARGVRRYEGNRGAQIVLELVPFQIEDWLEP